MSKMKQNRLVVAPGGWHESVPDWLKDEVKMERLVSGFADMFNKGEKEVGDAETCLYLFTASLSHPISHHMARIYIYLCTKLIERHGTTLPNNIAIRKLDADEKRKLMDLKREIYRIRGKVTHPLLDALNTVFKKEVRKCKREQ